MKNLTIFIFVLAAFTAAACGSCQRERASVDLFRIPFDLSKMESGEAPKMSDIVEDIEYIKLEYADGVPVGRVIKPYILSDGNILFFEPDTGILQYTRDGKFVRRIGSIGRGPGEFIYPVAIHVDEKEGIIYTISDTKNCVGRYELATGKFIGETTITEADGSPTRFSTRSYMPLTDDTGSFVRGVMSVSSGLDDSKSGKVAVYPFVVIDLPSAKIIHRERSRLYDDIPPEQLSAQTSTLWYDTEGRINLFERLADTVYVINNDFTLTPRMVVDFGMMKLGSLKYDDPGVSVMSVIEGARHMIFMAGASASLKMVCYDKQTGESVTFWPYSGGQQFISTGAVNDIDGGLAHLSADYNNLSVKSYDAFWMIENLTPEHFERVRERVKYPDRLEKLQALVATLKEEDNPVIVIARIKR
jgi:hypothetical protein